MARSRDFYLQWDDFTLEEFLSSPEGPIGEELFRVLAQAVLAGAKSRAERRTGRMIDAMTYQLGRDEQGLYADVISPVLSPGRGFPYAIVHEGRKVRDRRPHRSLRPALQDIRHILIAE